MFGNIFFYTPFFYILSFPLGYVLFKLFFQNKEVNLPFLVVLPIILSIGLTMLATLTFTVAFFIINPYVISALFLIPLAVLVFLEYRNRLSLTNIDKNIVKIFFVKNLIPLALFIIAFLNFALIVSSTSWPPVGDALEHGLITSNLLANGRIRLDYLPISTNSMDTALGFHTLAASFSSLTGLFPGQSVYLLAFSILVLVPMLVFSITYLVTRSNVLSTLAFVACFIASPPSMEYYLTGYFYNGPYPNIFGFLGLLLFTIIEIAKEFLQSKKIVKTSGLTILSLLTVIALIIIYPNFAVFPLIYFALRYSKGWTFQLYILSKKHWRLLLIAIVVALIAFIALFSQNSTLLLSTLNAVINKLGKMSIRNFSISSSFIESPIGLFTVASTVIALFCVYFKIQRNLSLIFLVIDFFCLLSLSFSPVTQSFAIFMPRRIVVVISVLSWVIFFTFMLTIATRFHLKREITRHSLIFGLSYLAITASLIFIILVPGLTSSFTFGAPPSGWYALSAGDDNYKVLQWVSANIPPNQLILNDYSYPSQFLLSFSTKNVTCTYHVDALNYNRTVDSATFWKHPDNYTNFHILTKTYGIKYVLVIESSGYDDWIGGNDSYVKNPFGLTTRVVFDGNPYVTLVYESGLAAVYKINN